MLICSVRTCGALGTAGMAAFPVPSAEFQSVAFYSEKAPGSLVSLCGSSSARSLLASYLFKNANVWSVSLRVFHPNKNRQHKWNEHVLVTDVCFDRFSERYVSLLWVLSCFDPLAGRQAICLAWWTKLVRPLSLRCCFA